MSNRKKTVLSTEIVTAVEDCGFFESIPLWAVTLIGGLFITVLSFIMIMSVYGRFFKLYLYTAIAPVPLSSLRESRARMSAGALSRVIVTAATSGLTTGGEVANTEKIMQASTMIAPSRHTAQ